MDIRRAILSQLLRRPMSLADLGTVTGSSLPTLRRGVQDLVVQRFVRPAGRETGTGGRPATLFGVDGEVHTIVGVHLAHPGMRLVATDLAGVVLDEVVPERLYDLEPDEVHAEVLAYLDRLERRFPERRTLGIGVATPGYVDPATGTVITIGRVPDWNNLPLRDRLADASGARVVIGNDLDALATAELGPDEEARTYAYVGLAEGLKFTMFVHGKPYLGPFGNAGLVAPTLLAEGGGAEAAELLKVRGLVAADASRDHERTPDDPVEVRRRFDALLTRAAAREPDADRLVRRMAEVLAAQVASFVHLVQPGLVVFGGALAGAPDAVLDVVEGALRRRLPTLLDNNLIVRRARVTADEATAAGATRAFLQWLLAEEGEPLVDQELLESRPSGSFGR